MLFNKADKNSTMSVLFIEAKGAQGLCNIANLLLVHINPMSNSVFSVDSYILVLR